MGEGLWLWLSWLVLLTRGDRHEFRLYQELLK